MKVLVCKTDAEELVADCFQEWSMNEHRGIRNVLLLAITGNNEVVLGALHSDITEELHQMINFARGYTLGREEFDEELMRQIANDEIPEYGGEDYDDEEEEEPIGLTD